AQRAPRARPAPPLERGPQPFEFLEGEARGAHLGEHFEDEAGVPGVVLDQQDPDPWRGGEGHGRDSFTISSQNCSMDRTTRRNCSRSTGFVTYALARSR